MKKALLLALKAGRDYAVSPAARRYEIALLSGLAIAVVDAIKAALGL